MLISIIIPSAGRRPKFLQRAIKSALINDEQIQTEVIVVLNGTDGMAFDLSQSFQHQFVKYYKIEQGNVCKARNYGLVLAQGDLIRFLDDDDFLYPDVAYRQYSELFHSDADLSTYAGAIEDNNTRYQIIEPIDIADYCAATLSENCIGLPLLSVYKNKIICNLKWDEKIRIPEDEHWMRTIAANNDIKWIKQNDVVGVWYQHDIDRLSFPMGHLDLFKNRHISIQETLQKLIDSNRTTPLRLKTASNGLWSCIHGGFHFSPIYWTKVALYAKQLNPQARPKNTFFDTLFLIDPILLEWLIIPIRWISRYYRKIKSHIVKAAYVRKL
ncbi:glycosyltransferase family 2 protein [Acinetobacter johnsonii]|uniref:glycosyltransferase family 2 protein n=1 Tax=Acinetobacter johnsonii TaxID=40214 RepID=UPI002169B2C3|nr:glycosyltransferase family A protein [Acinetobacter johnsonii]MCS3525538.1 glycosyltransferase involved in cell wall biosynthesis [Acinetobacter johnsonii]